MDEPQHPHGACDGRFAQWAEHRVSRRRIVRDQPDRRPLDQIPRPTLIVGTTNRSAIFKKSASVISTAGNANGTESQSLS